MTRAIGVTLGSSLVFFRRDDASRVPFESEKNWPRASRHVPDAWGSLRTLLNHLEPQDSSNWPVFALGKCAEHASSVRGLQTSIFATSSEGLSSLPRDYAGVAPGTLGAGVSVIMRYTLRLLTLDQLSRAAGLVGALERIRIGDAGRKKKLGDYPVEIGLWVGGAAMPSDRGHRVEDRAPGEQRLDP